MELRAQAQGLANGVPVLRGLTHADEPTIWNTALNTALSTAPDTTLPTATISELDGVRYLHLDSIWVQGAMRLSQPATIELEYVQRMMAWLLTQQPLGLAKKHAVQLGLGAGAITRFCHGTLRMRCTVVELNPQVIHANRLFFRLPAPGPRLDVVQGDAAHWVADPAHHDSADVLCVDLYDAEAAAPVLDSEAFYRDCQRVLCDGGVLSVNLFGRDASFERSARRVARAFGADHVRSLQPTREGNTVLLALKNADWPERGVMSDRATLLASRTGLPCRKWLKMLRGFDPGSADPSPDSEAA
jgi:spermidine synthase